MALLLVGACRGAPPAGPPLPLWPEGLALELNAHTGSAVRGAAGRTLAPEVLSDAWCVRFELFALERLPTATLEPLASRAALVVAFDRADPLAPTPLFARECGLARGAAATSLLATLRESTPESARRGPLVGALAAGTTVGLELELSEGTAEPENFLREYPELGVVPKRYGLELSRDGKAAAARIALRAEDVAAPPAYLEVEDAAPIAGRPAGAPRLQRETTLLESPLLLDEGPLVLVFPARFEGTGAAAYAVAVELTRVPAEDVRAAFEARLQALAGELEQTAALARSSARALSPQEAEARRLASALAALADSPSPRATLLWVGGTSALARDVALVANDDALREFSAELAAAAQTTPDLKRPAELAWLVERTAYLFLARRTLAGRLEPALSAVFLRHAGETARYPSTLVGLVRGAASADGLRAALVREHQAMLRDANPAVRLRAADWLAVRASLPAGFDPLALPEEREAALRASEAAEEGAR